MTENYVILNFPALDFLVHKIKEREFQKEEKLIGKNKTCI